MPYSNIEARAKLWGQSQSFALSARVTIHWFGEAASRVCIFNEPVQQVPLSILDALQADDILFIDSTHVLRTGSDLCFELFEILPRLSFLFTSTTCFGLLNTQDLGWLRKTDLGMSCMPRALLSYSASLWLQRC